MHRSNATGRGFTLTELLITIAVVSILVAIAYPGYTESVRKQNRGTAKAALLDVAQRQEQFFADNKQYAGVLTSLGYTANPIAVNRNAEVVAVGSAAAIYQISVATPAPPRMTYTLSAAPQNAQAADTRCGTLTLTNTGARSAANAGCW